MSDFLIDLGQNPQARRLIKSLGLPIPMPQKLRRADGPWQPRPLADRVIAYGGADAALAAVVARTLCAAGAEPRVAGETLRAAFAEPGEAHGRRAAALDLEDVGDDARFDALVFDATALTDPTDLRHLYDFFHPLVGALGSSGRVVVLGRPPASRGSAAAAAAQAALEGFARSVAREVGRKGATAQVIYVEDGAEERLEPVLRFVLSPRAAFISGQPIHVTAEARGAVARAFTRPLEGKVALVTGAARGIGAATAGLLAAEGAHVVCLDRPADDGPCSQVARDLGGSVLLCDITDAGAPGVIAEHLRAAHGGVDIVVHNAGVTRDKTLARMRAENWDQAVDINLGAVTRITAALLDGVLRDGGRVICLSSVAGIAGNMGQSNYAASKRGIIGYVEKLAPTVADRGITVNAIAPGFIETRLTAAIPVMIREAARRLSNLGQGGLPQDVGEAITFLSTPDAVGVTGRALRVCGGAFIGA